jgi:hypothetical protein
MSINYTKSKSMRLSGRLSSYLQHVRLPVSLAANMLAVGYAISSALNAAGSTRFF